MSIKKFIAGLGLAIMVILSGCGPADEGGFLQLTVGEHVLTTSSSSRASSEQISAEQDIAFVKINMEGTISLSGGEDKSLFELKDVPGGKMLAFRTLPNPYDPKDTNKNGIYEIDITATSGTQSITYEAAYEIPIPTSAKNVLLGKTFYLDFVANDNNYSKVTFGETTFSTTRYFYDEGAAAIKNNSAFNTNINYVDNYFTYQDGGSNVKCTLKDEYNKRFSCQTGSSSTDRVYLDSTPSFVIPSNYTVMVKSGEESVTNLDFPHPQITSFSLTGNKASDNGKVQIHRSRLSGSFSYNIQVKGNGSARAVWSQITDGNFSIRYTLQSTLDSQVNSDCKFIEEHGNQGIHYRCGSIDINNTAGDADTTFEALVCDDTNLSNPDINCSWASIPVLFVDE